MWREKDQLIRATAEEQNTECERKKLKDAVAVPWNLVTVSTPTFILFMHLRLPLIVQSIYLIPTMKTP